MVDATYGDGILVVAFPDKDADTEFSFEYWVEELIEEMVIDEDIEETPFGVDMMLIYAIAGTGVCLLLICCCVICIIRRKRMLANTKVGMEVGGMPMGNMMMPPPEGTDRVLMAEDPN